MFRVIIADDENRIVKMLAASIPWTKLGLSIASFASDGMEALRLAEEKKADIIITDIRMPGLNGLELCEKLHEANPNIQIILISGYADFSYAQRAIQLGVLGYCLKPVDIQYLQKLLRQAVQNIRREVSLQADTLLDYMEEGEPGFQRLPAVWHTDGNSQVKFGRGEAEFPENPAQRSFLTFLHIIQKGICL